MLIGSAAVLAIAGIAAAAWVSFAPDEGPPAGPADLARGERLYAEACASCHGANLEGAANWREPGPDGRYPAPPHDETGHTWHHSDRLLFEITKKGTAAVVDDGYQSNMPGFGDTYSDAEIRDILAYIKSTWPEEQRTVQAEITAQDQAVR
ncbi:c-type cytochrome [Amorphus coralli]|uniref:c-type cytochrome n=1 Tax=Amorphus coralli TaxID=340680 RepID=UPI00035E3ACA|nr:cytochrome c [Amorphus coralli]